MNITILIFVFIYLFVDIFFYVYISNAYYNSIIKKIQGKPMTLNTYKYISFFICYLILGVVWYYLIGTYITKEKTLIEVLQRALLIALAIHGVFNTTLFFMFDNWDIYITIREILWGVFWTCLSAVLYYSYIKLKK